MSEFKVDEHGVTADGYHVLPKRAMASMYIGSIIALSIMTFIVFMTYRYTLSYYEVTGTQVIDRKSVV